MRPALFQPRQLLRTVKEHLPIPLRRVLRDARTRFRALAAGGRSVGAYRVSSLPLIGVLLSKFMVARLLDRHPDRRGVVIYPPYVRYSLLLQRPQQLLRALAERGYLAIFCTNDPSSDCVSGIRQVHPNLFVSALPLRAFRSIRRPVVYLSRVANWRRILTEIRGREPCVFYDYIDHLSV